MTEEQSAAATAFARQRAAMAVEGLTCPEKAVLLVLCIMGDRSGRSHPSIETLATRASCGRRTAFRVLDRLAELRLIDRETTTGKWTWYTVRLDQCPSDTGAAAAPVPQTTPTGATAAPNQPGTAKRKRTSSSPSRRAVAAGVGTPGDDLPALPGGASMQQWADFDEMRRGMTRGPKPKPWTASVAGKAIETLHKLATGGSDPGAVLDQSVLNGWQGLYPVKEDQHGRGSDRLHGGAQARGSTGTGRRDGFTSAIREAGAAARAHAFNR